MIADAIREMKEVPEVDELDPPLNIPELFIMAIATSIDALAVGVTFSFMEVNIFLAVSVIGIVTFVLSAIAVFIGNIFGVRFRTIAQVAGGAILVLLGTRILLTHLGII